MSANVALGGFFDVTLLLQSSYVLFKNNNRNAL